MSSSKNLTKTVACKRCSIRDKERAKNYMDKEKMLKHISKIRTLSNIRTLDNDKIHRSSICIIQTPPDVAQ